MIYGGTILTPLATPLTAPLDTVFSIQAGMIYVLKLYFPPGSSGLLHVQIFDSNYQAFPTTTGQSFSGDNIDFSFDETYDKSNPPWELIVRSWNDDTDYAHECGVYIGQVSKDEYIQRFVGSTAVADILKGMSQEELTKGINRRTRIAELLETFGSEEGK
jgi:hypothetical protein